MAYAALSSLHQTIEVLSHSSRISVDSSTEEILESVIVDLLWPLRRTLQRYREAVSDMEEQILIEEARKLEDAIEFPISAHFLVDGCSPTFSFNLDQLTQDVDCFAKAAKKMKQKIKELWEQKARKIIEKNIEELFVQKTASHEEKEEEDVSSPTHMVGLFDQFSTIRDELTSKTARDDAKLISETEKKVTWISGMAGIGKTTLAKRVYHDPSVMANFECRAFVRVGREYSLKEILQAIIAQLDLDMEEDEDLFECFRTILSVRKSLVVLDDVGEDTDIYDLIGKLEKIEDSGSWILVTSRSHALLSSRKYGIAPFKMRFLNEEESWEVLKRNVFGEEEENCPKELVKAGKKIANKCGGLPLLIIAVADQLLSKIQKNPECWNEVAEKPNSVLEDACHQISEVLLSSYHPLGEDLKLHFLYIVAFPLNNIVWRNRIANLWCAEGFIRIGDIWFSNSFQFLHEKNLVLDHLKSRYRVISKSSKAYSLHCAYWYVSKRVAKNNKFLYVINSYEDGWDECVENYRRLAIHNNVLLAIKEVHDTIASISSVRSLLCTGSYRQYQVPMCLEWKLLRVLDALTIRFYEFPVEVVKLIRLRYLTLTCNENLPRSISKLWNLQFLTVHQHLSIKGVVAESYVPVEIWDLQQLFHLQIMGRNLPDPPPGVTLPKLRKLLDVGVESCIKGVLESMPKLEKLKIQIDDAENTLSFFHHISCLHQLRSFQSVIMYPTLLHPPPTLSISKSRVPKLSLSGFGYPWEDLTKIAEFPYLRVLKLQCYAFQGAKWDSKEMRFPCLRYLLIEDTDLEQWTAGDETFPTLWYLTMKNCYELQEIPRISSMVNIELVDCNPLVETCAKQSYVAERAEVSASYSWEDKKR